MEWGRAEDRGKVASDRARVAWAVPLRGALPAPAGVRNAGIANRMNAEFPAFSGNARSAGPR